MILANLRPLLIGLAFTSLSVSATAGAAIKKGDKPSDFEHRTLAGPKLKLSSLRGKVVLIDFWASWCEPCKKEVPLLAHLAERLRPMGIEIVTINIDDDVANAKAFLHEHGVTLTVIPDVDKSIVSAFEPPTMPSSYVIDPEGVVREVNKGFEAGDEKKIEKQLVALKAR